MTNTHFQDGEVLIFLEEAKVYSELLNKVRTLVANVAHNVRFTAYESTFPLHSWRTEGKEKK